MNFFVTFVHSSVSTAPLRIFQPQPLAIGNMATQHYTILVAEDDQYINSILCELLEDAGYTVIGCFDGLEAFTIATRLKPNVVITDMSMEVPDAGFRLVERLRQDPGTAGVGVIICSANSTELERRRARAAELDAHLVHKPFNLNHLLSSIGKVLQERPG
jgi:two-component system, OmpR family, phosphate regulon response regulator PhoB